MENIKGTLKSLSDETRLEIILLLLEHDFCVRALAKRIGISEAAVSQHLQILRKADLVRGEKRGYFTHYSVNRGLLEKTGEELIKMSQNYPAAAAEGCSKNSAPGHKERCRFREVMEDGNNN